MKIYPEWTINHDHGDGRMIKSAMTIHTYIIDGQRYMKTTFEPADYGDIDPRLRGLKASAGYDYTNYFIKDDIRKQDDSKFATNYRDGYFSPLDEITIEQAIWKRNSNAPDARFTQQEVEDVAELANVLPFARIGKIKPGVLSRSKKAKVDNLIEDVKNGRVNGKVYRNDGRDASQILPKKAKDGDILYLEFDLNKPPTASQRANGATRDKSRVIIGSDGSVWITNQHYKKGSVKKISDGS